MRTADQRMDCVVSNLGNVIDGDRR